MKINCRIIIISFIVCIVSICCIVIFSLLYLKTDCKLYDIFLNLFISLFTSSCVSLLVAIPAYISYKRQLLESIWSKSEKLAMKIGGIHFLFCDYNIDTLSEYLRKMKIKENRYCINKSIDMDISSLKNKLIEERFSPEAESETNIKHLYNYRESIVDKEIEKIRNSSREIYSQYIDLSKESTEELSFLLDDMQFLFGNKRLLKIENETFKPLKDTIKIIKEHAPHFSMYLDGEGNESQSLKYLFLIQKEIFTVKKEDINNSEICTVYNDVFNNTMNSIIKERNEIFKSKYSSNEDYSDFVVESRVRGNVITDNQEQ